MPKSKFDSIYKDIKNKIETEVFEYQSLLPSENSMTETYDCSRNTIRRALALLAEQGYIQPINGVGVRIVYRPVEKANFTIGGIESFKETTKRNNLNCTTKVVHFAEIVTDDRISKRTGFAVGEELYYVQRVRYLDGVPYILDINIFSKKYVPSLTEEIAAQSIYEYIEHELGMEIALSKRRMTVERVTPADEKYLEVGDYNCLAVVTGQTFNSMGMLFEYTQSRHVPDHFCFENTANRTFQVK